MVPLQLRDYKSKNENKNKKKKMLFPCITLPSMQCANMRHEVVLGVDTNISKKWFDYVSGNS